jgi:hypothetical protein
MGCHEYTNAYECRWELILFVFLGVCRQNHEYASRLLRFSVQDLLIARSIRSTKENPMTDRFDNIYDMKSAALAEAECKRQCEQAQLDLYRAKADLAEELIREYSISRAEAERKANADIDIRRSEDALVELKHEAAVAMVERQFRYYQYVILNTIEQIQT